MVFLIIAALQKLVLAHGTTIRDNTVYAHQISDYCDQYIFQMAVILLISLNGYVLLTLRVISSVHQSYDLICMLLTEHGQW